MRFLGKPSLQKRISLLVFAGLTLVLVLFGWLGIQSLNESTQRTLDERLDKARIVAGFLDQNLKYVLVNLENVADFDGAMPDDAQFHHAAVALAAAAATSDIVTEAVFLVGADGKILQVEPPRPGISEMAPDERTGTANSLTKGVLSVSSLVYEPLTGVPVVFATAPIRDRAGAPIGALSMAINVGKSGIANIIKPITLGATGYTEVVDSNGVVLARTDPGRPPDPFERSDHPDKFAMLIAEGKAAVRTCHRCHGAPDNPQRSSKDVLAFAPLTNAAWGVAIRQPEEEAFAITNQLKTRLALLGGIAVMGAFLLVWVVTQGVVRPVRALTDAATRVAAGDFKAIVPVKGQDEIGQLGAAFAAMTGQLARATDELVSRNRELASLNSIAATVGQSLDLDQVSARALQRVVEVTGTNGGCVFLIHGPIGDLKPASRLGYAELFACPGLSSSQGCACHQVLHLGHTMLVNDIAQCPALAQQAVEQVAGFVSLPLKSQEKALGVMNLCYSRERYFTEQDLGLLDTIGRYVGLAAENAILYQEAKQKEALRGRLLNAAITAQEEERKRLARELHDEFGQTLTGLIMSIESIEVSMPAGNPPHTEKLAKARLVTARALQELRKLIQGLRSAVLDDLGLVAAIRSHAENQLESAGIRVAFLAEGMSRRLPASVETSLFRIAQEAINNVIKHARAKSVTINLKAGDGRIVLTVEDDGRGFDAEALFNGDNRLSLGLVGMRERTALLGGTFNIVSRPGQGTRIVVEVPAEPGEPADGWPEGRQEALSG